MVWTTCRSSSAASFPTPTGLNWKRWVYAACLGRERAPRQSSNTSAVWSPQAGRRQMNELVEALLSGNRRALARMLTAVENEREGVQEALAALFPHTGAAQVIGVTGAPGTGKSTLVGALARGYRRRGQTVGILAIDPTSPFTGGAILGDRIRMSELAGDSGVFIRSMATRGQLGGLARATADAVRVLDAAGFQIVIVETVGAGQSEVDIAQTAQTTLVVEAPGL